MMLYNKNLEQYSTGNMRLTIRGVLKISKLDLLFDRLHAVLVFFWRNRIMHICYLLNIVPPHKFHLPTDHSKF